MIEFFGSLFVCILIICGISIISAFTYRLVMWILNNDFSSVDVTNTDEEDDRDE